MNEEYIKKIDTTKEMLNLLPQNNKKNKTKFKEIVLENLNEFKNDEVILLEEIKKRYNVYMSTTLNEEIPYLDNELSNLKDSLILSNKYASSYQMSSLDKVLYNLSHFYKEDLESVNSYIKEAILIFKSAGITLSIEDFNYSYYTKEYMMSFLSDASDIKEKLESIYWKCPDLIFHIALNFKYLYYLNIKSFNNCYKENSVSYTNIYKNLVSKRSILLRDSKYTLLHDLLDGKLSIGDFKQDKINSLISSIYTGDELNFEDLNSLYDALVEYKGYTSVLYIVNDIKEKYKDKDKYKNDLLKTKKEIAKKEKKLFKDNKKISKFISKGKTLKVDYFNNLINNDINELKDLYEELESNSFLLNISTLDNTSKIEDILYLAISNYEYLCELCKTHELDYLIEYDKLFKLVYSPGVNIINNIWMDDEKDIPLIIIDKYNLYGYKLTKDMLSSDNLDSLISSVNLIITSKYIKKYNISEEMINFIKESNNLL